MPPFPPPKSSEPAANAALRVVVFGTFDLGKPRVRLLLEGLRAHGVTVACCHVPVWGGIEDKSQLRGARAWGIRLARILAAYPALAWRYWRLPRHDVVLVPYPGLVDVFVARPLAWLRGVPLAWDWFIGAHDTLVDDRKMLRPNHPLAWVVRAAEWMACRLADVAFMDTRAHARRMEQAFGLSTGHLGRVLVGAETSRFSSDHGSPLAPRPADVAMPGGEGFTVLFYGQLIPLHGVSTIVEAARRLREAPVDWVIVGQGQEGQALESLLAGDPLPRVHRVPWVPYEELGRWLRQADAALGIFGGSAKAGAVIPNKVFQVLAANRPLITRQSDAIGELIEPGTPGVWLVPPNDPQALAQAVRDALEQWVRGSLSTPDLDPDRLGPRMVGKQFLELLQQRLGLRHPLPVERS